MPEKSLLSWSGGKDSALALYELGRGGYCRIEALLTVLTGDYDRISMHGVRRELLESLAQMLGMPLEKVFISKSSSKEEYEEKMRVTLLRSKGRGVTSVVFGDIFLEDLKKYREDKLREVGMQAVFPLWKRDTAAVAASFIDLGFKAVVTCIDSKVLDKSFAGRIFDQQFLRDLPPNVDPCGENGEFHSFVYAGPIFKSEVLFDTGEIVLRDGRFYYCDLLPKEESFALTPKL